MSENIGWARRLSVAADAKGIIGHAGAVLLRGCADQTGLTGALSTALRVRGRSPGWDPGVVLVQLAVAIVLEATSMSDIALLEQQAAVFGAPASDSTVRRALVELDAKATARIDYPRMRGVPGSHHPWFADVLHRRRGGAAGAGSASTRPWGCRTCRRRPGT